MKFHQKNQRNPEIKKISGPDNEGVLRALNKSRDCFGAGVIQTKGEVSNREWAHLKSGI